MDHNASTGIGRRRLLGWGGLAAAGVVAGAPLAGARPAHADPAPPGDDRIPPDTLPGGAYDRYVAELAAEGKFSGVVLLSHRGRTVLSRGYGMADREKGIRNHEGTAFNLSSAGKPFGAVAILQLVQQGKLKLYDTVGTYLTGFPKDIADQVTIHHMLSGTSGMDSPDEDVQRVFQSREEVLEYNLEFAHKSKLVAPVGTPTNHAGSEIAIPALILQAVTGMTYWDYVQENIFKRCGMTGSGFYTRPQWLTDPHIAHPYMTLADGSQVDAVRNLDKSSPNPIMLGKNPGRAFIDAPGDGGFTTATDLVRFARGLADGTLLAQPYADLLTAPRVPHPPQTQGFRAAATVADASFGAYDMPVHIVNGQWVYDRAGANPGVGASWGIYPDAGWVGVVLGNIDGLPLAEMGDRLQQTILGG
ncbi:serine hydrolase domain-containing protein [Kutzneria kofuensis]|uniref:CubicO group peptidase (Beta-lactamase class C family) n=1 Tax=Kutzneria kofuensis TaxID=103725 RepID=A0A7W9KCG6_9PSEU|nr:serine hydrolase domain-containing protein [Kutzneria kofuensis]MBB5890070.1 CubicO group peptidase (beta-lactamase class C family) [Kutzneria kofuensis]